MKLKKKIFKLVPPPEVATNGTFHILQTISIKDNSKTYEEIITEKIKEEGGSYIIVDVYE